MKKPEIIFRAICGVIGASFTIAWLCLAKGWMLTLGFGFFCVAFDVLKEKEVSHE